MRGLELPHDSLLDDWRNTRDPNRRLISRSYCFGRRDDRMACENEVTDVNRPEQNYAVHGVKHRARGYVARAKRSSGEDRWSVDARIRFYVR